MSTSYNWNNPPDYPGFVRPPDEPDNTCKECDGDGTVYGQLCKTCNGKGHHE